MTRKELTGKLEMSDKTIRYYIDKLKEENIIERIGSTKSGYWKINK